MSIKKTKNIKKILNRLSKTKNYKKPYSIFIDTSFISKFNKQHHKISLFNTILLENPKLYVTECVYKKYKGEHKKKHIEELRKYSNHDKKKWNKERFVGDVVRYCEVRKCRHDSVLEEKECLRDYFGRRRKGAFVAVNNEEVRVAVEGYPVLFFRGSELLLEMNEPNDVENETMSDNEAVLVEEPVE